MPQTISSSSCMDANPEPKPSRPPPHRNTNPTNVDRDRDTCWNWSVGVCEHSPCKFLHIGEAGAQRSKFCDADGYCLKESKPFGCTKAKCPFNHRSQPKSRMNRQAHFGSPKRQTPAHPFANTTTAGARIAATMLTQGLTQGNADSEDEDDVKYIEPRMSLEEQLANAKVY